MNDRLRAELERLKERQAQLHHAVDLLGVHINALENRIADEKAPLEEVKAAGPEAGAPTAVPPLLATVESANIQLSTLNANQLPTDTIVQPATFNLQPSTAALPLTPPPLAPLAFTPPDLPPFTPAPPTAKSESFEMRLGTYWLVRIGIVAMLTALVFFGAYAYQNFIGKLGAGGKVALLYIASGVLLGFGAWFQRKAAKESLRNYAQVLSAGGLAAVYFTTYAAHHFPNLQVIKSAALDGALLLGWAGFMAWVADRKKSEVLALFAVGLAYYTSVITRAGHFTLYSNLVLVAAALFFLVRNRWTKLSFASLIATYASYGFWRFYSDAGWHWAGPDDGLWTGVYFIAAYWLLFAAAGLLSRDEGFAGVGRASFITLNNGAFYAMFLLTMLQVRSGGFWKFNLIMGAVLLIMAALAKVRLREEPLAANTYLTQGLLLVTVGLIAKFSGLQLALVLALESVVLWMTGTLRRNIVMRTGACVSAALAAVGSFGGIDPNDRSGAWLGAGVGGLLALNAFWAHWRGQANSPRLLRGAPTYFSALALHVWTFALWQNVGGTERPAWLALAALGLAAFVHITKLRELSLLAQLLVPLAAMHFVWNQAPQSMPEPAWVLASIAAVALALVHWWQRQRTVAVSESFGVGAQFVHALILVGIVAFGLQARLVAEPWLLAVSGLALGLTVYGAVTRNWVLALTAQIFSVLMVVSFFTQSVGDSVSKFAALAPLVVLSILSVGARRWVVVQGIESKPTDIVKQLALWYGRVAMALVMCWTFAYINSAERAWFFTLLGALALTVSGWRASREFLGFAAVLHMCALAALLQQLVGGQSVYWLNFVAVFAWLAEQQWARRQPTRFPMPAVVHSAVIISAGAVLWWLASQWVMRGFSGFYLTASWSVFAFGVFAAGILLRERVYRWLGLVVLGAAIGRVVIFDVWRLETLYRILSFFALGFVLLVLGFIYNKYQERIRLWL
jgi:uncharacterized membrane protein